jgi:hypothetical protein
VVIGTGRLEDDPIDRDLTQPLDERPMSVPVVIEASALAVVQTVGVEMVF